MASIFSGWQGYGTVVSGNVLSEPSDPAYVRRPVALGDLNGGCVSDVGSGTAGPATMGWGTIQFCGLFDAPVGGNLLMWFPLPVPVTVNSGGTITTAGGQLQLVIQALNSSTQVRTWPAGMVMAATADGRPVTAGVALQFGAGTLSAQASAFGSTVVMAALPQSQPVSGSGQLWNNGGVISVA